MSLNKKIYDFNDELNLNIPDPNKIYFIREYVNETNLTLLMKIILIADKKPEYLIEIQEKSDKYKDDINKQTKKGKTALMFACITYKPKLTEQIIKLLLELGADINIQDEYGTSALMYAIQYSEIEIIKLLLENGANVNIRNNNSCSVLYYLCGYNNLELIELIKLLLDNYLDINISDIYGETPLSFIVSQNDDKIINLMLNYCNDIFIPDNMSKDMKIKLYELKIRKLQEKLKIKKLLTHTDILNSKVLQYL